MRVYVFYRHFLDLDTQQVHLGGIENYILALSELLLAQGATVTVVQLAKQDATCDYAGIQIRGVNAKGYSGNRKKFALWRAVADEVDVDNDLLVFATDSYFIPTPCRSIAIQHGVSWDKPGKGTGLKSAIKAWLNQRKYLGYVEQCKNLVCVDHNFINWYRTFRDIDSSQRWQVITNFAAQSASAAEVAAKWQSPATTLLIARRFVEYRGILPAIAVVKALLQRFEHLQVSFAGEGPLQHLLEQEFAGEPRVKWFRYTPDQSLTVHLAHHYVLLPSIGSEGTSLSLLEAMAAGCAVVTTNVGGLSNIVLHNHNGRICMPTEEALTQQLAELIAAPKVAALLAMTAHQSVQDSFGKAQWQQQWWHYIQQTMVAGKTD